MFNFRLFEIPRSVTVDQSYVSKLTSHPIPALCTYNIIMAHYIFILLIIITF